MARRIQEQDIREERIGRGWIQMVDGWFACHRKIVESRVFNDKDPFILKLWMWCMCRANWKRGWKFGRELAPGQFITGEASASEQLNVANQNGDVACQS